MTISSLPCHHVHDTTTRYDHATKLLSFLLICPMCGTERVVETRRYEPRFIPRDEDGHGLALPEAA